jgi:hypothetical protein
MPPPGVRALSREERELMSCLLFVDRELQLSHDLAQSLQGLAANNGHLLAFDNLSGLPPWLSNALCRLATRGSFAVRRKAKKKYSERASADSQVVDPRQC